DGDTLTVSRSVWKSFVSEPKTEASAAPVHVPRQLRELLELHRAKDGWPTSGPIFRTGLGTPLGLDNVRSRMILPVLNRCATCGKASGASHRNEEHEHKRDEIMPRWHGWHAFRRGVATDLQKAGVKVAQGALRHSDPGVTMRSYAKTVPDD